MQYKTIVLELLIQRTQLHEQLRSTRQLLPAMESYARELKDGHLTWMATLAESRPGSDPSQISSEALELALNDLEERLPAGSPTSDGEVFSLDQAIAFVRRPSPKK